MALFRSAAAGAAFFSLLVVLPTSARGQSSTFEWIRSMDRGQTLEVRGITGEIRATLSSDDRAQVFARKRGEEADFHQVAVEVAEVGDKVVICAVYGAWRHGQGRCHPDRKDRDDDGHRNVDMDVRVDYEVRVPAGVEFEGMVVAGNIQGAGLRSDVSARTVDGRISMATSGRARAHSVSGDIEVEMGEPGQEMDFHTVSGDITLRLPSDYSADIRYSSLSGHFHSDFDLDFRRETKGWVGREIEATIGGGGRRLSLRTVSGDVEVLRAGK